MNKRLLLTALLSLCFVGSAAVHAQDSDKDTELGGHMKKVGKAAKQLGKQINDSSQNASSEELVATMHTELQAALDLKPEKEADLPADQQAAFQAKYQDSLKEFLAQVDKLSDLLKAGDNAGASAQLKKLFGMEKKDHKEYKKPHND